MPAIRITKEFRYEGAHALYNYDGKCRQIHGHSYILYVTVQGSPINEEGNPKDGMVMDLGELKRIVHETVVDKFDHALVLRCNNPFASELGKEYSNIVLVDFQPTCENMLSFFAQAIGDKLPDNVKLYSLKLHETASSFVEWYAQ